MSDNPEIRVPILRLPLEILSQIPYGLENLDELYALLCTSRLFYQICSKTPAKLALSSKLDSRLAVIGTARQIADWAVESQQNREKVGSAISGGNAGLLALAVEVARLRLDDVRALHRAQKSVIQPLALVIEKNCRECGQKRFFQRHCMSVETALYDFVTYCELFFHDINCNFYRASATAFLGAQMRRDWISKCVYDLSYQRREDEVRKFRTQRLRDLENLLCLHLPLAIIRRSVEPLMIGCLPLWFGRSSSLITQNFLTIFASHRGLVRLDIVLQGGFRYSRSHIRLYNDLTAMVGAFPDERTMREVSGSNSAHWRPLSIELRQEIERITH